jgi:hypothetical protein
MQRDTEYTKENRTKERVDSQANNLVVFIIKDWWAHILKLNEKIEGEELSKRKKGTNNFKMKKQR